MPQILRSSKDTEIPDNGRQEVARDEAAQRDAAQADEANMRRALGMLGGTARPAQVQQQARDRRPASPAIASPRRHRFVQDGDVPVTMMRARADNPAEAPSVSGASPVNRLDALQAAFTAEHAARERAERALEEAQAMIRDLRTKLAHMELAREEALRPRAQTEAAPEPQPAPVEKPRRKLAVARPPRAPKEPKPVKWWVKPRAKKALHTS